MNQKNAFIVIVPLFVKMDLLKKFSFTNATAAGNSFWVVLGLIMLFFGKSIL